MGSMKAFIVTSLALLSLSVSSQTQLENCLPAAKQNVFVYDIANLLSDEQELSISYQLTAFKDTTSNVIIVVTHPDFCGYEPSVFAIEAGDHMGVGRNDLDNGIVMAIKPRNNSGAGQIFIAIGEGLEGAIPDVLTGRIVNRMIPDFKNGNWSSGINLGLSDLMLLSSGEISESEYAENHSNSSKQKLHILLFFVLMFGMILIIAILANTIRVMRVNNLAFGAAFAIILAEIRIQHNAYNHFSHGTGRYINSRSRSGGSGGSGGFGGFGGGGFGGGGAGGSF